MRRFRVLLLLYAVMQASSQTTIDLGTQARNVDFSKAVSTRPIKTGTALPPNCTTGDLFFLQGKAEVIYACTATNIWTLQSRAEVTGTGLIAQTAGGAAVRVIAAGRGMLVTNADGESGNPTVAADVASSEEAQGGIDGGKLMTSERVRQSFQAWNPFPVQAGKAGGWLSTDGVTPFWSWKLVMPASGTQSLGSSLEAIAADRSFVRIEPLSTFTFTSSPVIADGADGQFVTIVNVSAAHAVTLPDEAVAPGSNLRLGGGNITLGPRESVTLVYSNAVGDWITTQKPVSGEAAATAGVSGPASTIDGEMAVFDGTSGTALRSFGSTGVVRASNGVPSVVSGNALDCVRVDGSSGACGGNVTGPVASVPGQMALYEDTTGRTLTAGNFNGVLKSSNGVPSIVTGTASDCIRVDGSSGPCGSAPASMTVMDYTWYPTASSGISGSGTSVASGWQVPGSSATVTTNGSNAVMAFSEAAGAPAGYIGFKLPSDFAGGAVSLKMHFSPGATGCGTGTTVIWKVRTGAYGQGETVNVFPVWSTYSATGHSFEAGAADKLHILTLNAPDVTSWEANKRAVLWVERDSANDTAACTINMLGLEVGLRRTLQ